MIEGATALMAQKPADRTMTAGQYHVMGGIALLVAVAAWFYLHHAETSGGTVVIPRLLAPVYEKLGATGIAGVIVLIAALNFIAGVRESRRAVPGSATPPPANQTPSDPANDEAATA